MVNFACLLFESFEPLFSAALLLETDNASDESSDAVAYPALLAIDQGIGRHSLLDN